MISIHAPVKGATSEPGTTERLARISIHAPVKGATSGRELPLGNHPISIHAPVKGATCSARPSPSLCTYFNPRTREGCDFPEATASTALRDFNPRTREGCDACSPPDFRPHYISIHAPVKGATRCLGLKRGTRVEFQSTHP